MVVAGDPSGDRLAARMVIELKRLSPRVKVFGLGGPELAATGMDVRLDLTREALTGFTEVLRHLPRLWRIFREASGWLSTEKPDAVVLVDYPGFNLRFAGEARRAGCRVAYYVAPQVWAWHEKRLEILRRCVDRLLVIFPFEECYFREKGLSATYVGYPPLETLPRRRLSRSKVCRLFQIPFLASPLIAVLPGSRPNEVRRVWPVFRDAARKLRMPYPNAGFVVVRPPHLSPAEYAGVTALDPFTFVEGPAYEVRAACDLAWVKSGTATVETALLGTPQILAYRVSGISAFLARRLLRLSAVGMVNLLAGRRVVPELLQEEASPRRLMEETLSLWESKVRQREQIAAFRKVRASLSHPRRPSARAAWEVLSLLSEGGGA